MAAHTEAGATRGRASGTPAQHEAADAATNVWDAVIALVVCATLVALAWFLARHYADGKDAQGMFGIAAPVLAAAFGVAIGVPAGNKAGRATGRKQGRKEMADKVTDVADRLDRSLGGHFQTLTTELESPAGEGVFRLAPGRELSLDASSIDRTRHVMGELRGVIDGAG